MFSRSSILIALVAAAICLATLLQPRGIFVDGTRIKIHLANDDSDLTALGRLRPRQAPQSACDDKRMITNIRGAGLPQSILSNPRFNHSRVKFYSSATAKTYIDAHIYTRKVSGLGEQTVRNVFDMLRGETCYPFFYGGLVRDQFLGRKPGDVDAEVDCEAERVNEICCRTWGDENCQYNNYTQRAHIGKMVNSSDDLLDFASTNATFFAPLSHLEYTVNALAYDLNEGNNIILDLPGKGVMDVCNRVIRIPSDDGSEQSWDEWRMAPGGTQKLYRFWKLRAKDLMPVDNQTRDYIVDQTVAAIRKDPKSFEQFYCDTVYGYGNFNSETKKCEVSSAVCSSSAGKDESYRQLFKEDLGDSYGTVSMVLNLCSGKCSPLQLCKSAHIIIIIRYTLTNPNHNIYCSCSMS